MSGPERKKTERTQREDEEKQKKAMKRAKTKEGEHCQELLDEGIEESFPASDPPSVSHID